MRKIRKTKLVLIGMIIAVTIVTAISTLLAFSFFRNQKINSLGQRATSFAVALGSKDVTQLAGDDSDLTNPTYIDLKDKLIKLQGYNSDTRFVYLMGQKDNDIFFYADSEDPSSPDYSPPGQVYDEASPVLRSVFTTGKIQTEVGSDRWGKWLSVMAPIIDYNTNQVVGMVGFDMTYNVYLTEIILFTMLPIAIGITILILLIATLLNVKKDEELLIIRSEYFAIAAHDLRTPLTGIKFAMSTLKRSILPSNSADKSKIMMDQITQSTDNMLLSVNELLDSSTLEKTSAPLLVLKPVNIISIIENNLKALEISAKQKKLKITWMGPVELLINGDADKLHRVFANLLSNAIKYSKDGGVVKINAKAFNKQKVVISIKDSGIGIPAKEQEQIFNGYFRASNAKEFTKQGTGLGLYYVKNIVELHKGNIKLISAPNKGTEIILDFPISQN